MLFCYLVTKTLILAPDCTDTSLLFHRMFFVLTDFVFYCDVLFIGQEPMLMIVNESLCA